MIAYGMKKLGSGKIHSHNKCGVCGCWGNYNLPRIVSKKRARFKAKREIYNELERF